MEYYLGIDIGTTALKGVAFSAAGLVIASHAVEYPLLHDGPEESELEPETVYQAFLEVVENIRQGFPGTAPVLVSFSAAMHSLMAVDAQGQPLSRLLTWADNRAAGEARQLHLNGSASGIYGRTGVPVHAMSPSCKLLYWQNHPPDWFDTAARFIGIKEFLFFVYSGFMWWMCPSLPPQGY